MTVTLRSLADADRAAIKRRRRFKLDCWTGLSPALPPTTGLRSPGWSDPGSPHHGRMRRRARRDRGPAHLHVRSREHEVCERPRPAGLPDRQSDPRGPQRIPRAVRQGRRANCRRAAGRPAFSRLYLIPGLYHCPCGQPVDGDPATTVQFMPQLVAWVERGEAPGAITLPVTAQTAGAHLMSLRFDPFDPLQPAPNNNGLNSNYRYIGESSDYRPGNASWCPEQRQPLTCSPR